MTLDITTAVRGGTESDDGTSPLLLLLHGYGSNEHDLPGLVTHLGWTGPWASLRAPIDMPSGGASWVPIVVPGRPDEVAAAEATDAVLQWLDREVKPGTPIIPLGFSQGGLMATQLLRLAPDRVGAAIVLAGFILGAELENDAALAATRPPVFYGRGEDDHVIAPDAVERTLAWLPAHTTPTVAVYPGLTHTISVEELGDVRDFLAAVDPQVVPRQEA